ncbi:MULTISPECIES: DUF1906 domain-containing protein [Corynebacterium]|uniref:DUF1906 domain-containing protein n=1 Tax=Corynebacterium accolens TaxID=38284 RepID=A0AAP4BYB5_9CORY|nr:MULTISPECIES: DUF1906 domain-containing protein [Corynebacterium]ERS43894.1 hypothetical protein HMPREF1293_00849 [Corynebacterium sp. KPL1996]ERS45594.1 hypothetical protein HMPREF1287_00026 [Corynebacterium sp. KPL1986]ERS70843.1 hypothetical protein HMPREF1295_02068 [Corynebacterium sp. KPL1998]ERS70908.1 hypothetical protein HMPREF1300_01657 [Corynebacterium sp. KPL2004]MDK4246092.1 DUF1906 domain-containing protein [Corynebacterium accolens]
MSPSLSRRGLLKASALALTAGAIGAAAPSAAALGPVRGTIIDFSSGIPSPAAIKRAGHIGAIRYVSNKRPGAAWMTGKPVTLQEAAANAAAGLPTASVYQFGRAETADWKQGAAGAAIHAPQAISLHKAAGGPTHRPIYIAIDDNPTREHYTQFIRPYLQAFSKALSVAGYQTGVYGNYNTIEWASQDGIGTFYWMHDWGSNGKIHPKTTIHQLPQSRQQTIENVIVDVNEVYASDWGQWTPGSKQPGIQDLSSTLDKAIPNMPELPQLNADGVSFKGSSLSNEQIRGLADAAQDIAKAIK